jgi:hypothetical protein
MKTNIGSTDKLIRVGIALVIATLYYFEVVSGILAIVLMIVAGVLVLTTLFGVCPLYLPFGINTSTRSRTAHK